MPWVSSSVTVAVVVALRPSQAVHPARAVLALGGCASGGGERRGFVSGVASVVHPSVAGWMTDRRACVTVGLLCDWGANMAELEYTSVGTIRWEREAVFFTPDGDHCVKWRKDKRDGEDTSSAVFVDGAGCGPAVPLTDGELKLKIKSQDCAMFAAAAGGAAKVKIAIEIASETKLSETKLKELGGTVEAATAELVSVPAE